MKKTPIKLIENHDEAYWFWKKLGLLERLLVHLDAHVDFNFHPAKPLKQTMEEAKSKEDLAQQLSTNLMYNQLNIKEKSLTNIGNYIYPAMRDGIITDFYWIIPGDREEFKRSLKNLRNMLKSFFPRDPFETRKIMKEKGMLKAKIYGRDFIITTLQDLPENINGAILDIDTDYLTTDTIRKAGPSQDAGKRFPWIWPEELVSKLNKKKIQPSSVTIAYSVNGGFTPLIYKFLGDEVAIFIRGIGDKLKGIISAKNRALALFNKGKIEEAIDILKESLQNLDVVKINPRLKNKLKAHIAFILFRCYATLNDLPKAKFYYNLTITSDKTYKIRDNNYGPLYLRRKGNLKKAEQEFKFILSVDRNNPYAICGLANIFMRRKDIKRAKTLFKKAYGVDKKNRESLLGLGQAELRLKNYKSALEHLESYKSKNRMQNVTYSLKASAYEGLGRFDKALEEYKFAHRFGADLNLYLRLFRLLRKTGIPKEHSEWIKNRIDTYKNYKRDFFKLEERRTTRQIQTDRIKRLINLVDKMIEKVWKKDG